MIGELRRRVVAAIVKGLLYINGCGLLQLVPEDAAERANFASFSYKVNAKMCSAPREIFVTFAY
ncbi:hypothetical protein [uncultured Akkermansia sp.]|uniref:hypothetical protein n=1 Tax=uncultured Akkermansia sp. TaxID=512294 RepID=UPI00265D2AAB|nr:hypothetical protein [uncultured Akkermansia sp.]